MKLRTSIIVFFFTFFSIQLLSQRIIDISHSNKYDYAGELYKFPELDQILSTNVEAHRKYVLAKRAGNTAKVLGYSTLTVIGIGGIFLITEDSSIDGITTADVVAVLSWFIVAPAIGSAALITKFISDERENKAIELFNNSSELGYIPNAKQWELNVGGAQYGYGLVLNF